MGHLISIAKWPISLRHHHCSLLQKALALPFGVPAMGQSAVPVLVSSASVYKMENVCCFGTEMSIILEGQCKQKITSEPNRNESGID